MKANKIILISILIFIIAGVVFVLLISKKEIKEVVAVNKDEENILIIGDNYFITQINDIYLNPDKYNGRNIEIEGIPFLNEDYTFVGRYGPGCCVNDQYAYIEFQYDGEVELKDQEGWIKVKGTINIGNDGYSEYTYIKANSVEIKESMRKKGSFKLSRKM